MTAADGQQEGITRLARAFEECWITSGQAAAIEEAVRVLNEALAADPVAMAQLMNVCVTPITPELLSHRTIQCGRLDDGRLDDGAPYVRMLGLINGLFGADVDQWGYIAADYDADGVLERFRLTPAPEESA